MVNFVSKIVILHKEAVIQYTSQPCVDNEHSNDDTGNSLLPNN